jgi:hypothetical protein
MLVDTTAWIQAVHAHRHEEKDEFMHAYTYTHTCIHTYMHAPAAQVKPRGFFDIQAYKRSDPLLFNGVVFEGREVRRGMNQVVL